MREYYVCNKGDEHRGWMDGCMVWWRAEGRGYTYDLNFAGVFTDVDRAKSYPPDTTCHYIPKELVDAYSYSPRLAFWSRARLQGGLPICEALAGHVRSAVSAPEDKAAYQPLGTEKIRPANPPQVSGRNSSRSSTRSRSNQKAVKNTSGPLAGESK
jgi:hypothetical protein